MIQPAGKRLGKDRVPGRQCAYNFTCRACLNGGPVITNPEEKFPINGGTKMKCIKCGMTIPEMPEDATAEELLCNLCYEQWEEKQNETH